MKLLDLIYPPRCFHCKREIETAVLFCAECLQEYSLISAEQRCSKCFEQLEKPVEICDSCEALAHPFEGFGSCFEQSGPANTLLQAFLKQGHFRLAKDIASSIVLQLDQLNFPPFDSIVMIPNFFQNPQFAIGKELAKFLKCPLKKGLKRDFFSHSRLFLKSRCKIIGECVLLLDVVRQSKEVMHTAGWALRKGNPKTVYGMTFCDI